MACQLRYVVLVVYWWCVTGEFMSGRSLGDVFVQTRDVSMLFARVCLGGVWEGMSL